MRIMAGKFSSLEMAASVIRRELSNLRKQVDSLKHMVKSEVAKLNQLLQQQEKCSESSQEILQGPQLQKKGAPKGSNKILTLSEMAIGCVRSCFKEKNGTPRQPGLCSKATCSLTVEAFSNPSHSLEGLEEYSHIWLLFVFHKNDRDSVKPKIRPPCLNGRKVGVFASRSPHRPCPIGLTLAKLESIERGTLHLSGIDLIDGTPILDVKPYIPRYDSLQAYPTSDKELQGQRSKYSSHFEGGAVGKVTDFTHGQLENETESLYPEVKVASWLAQRPVSLLEVEFLPQAEEQLKRFKRQTTPLPSRPEISKGEGIPNVHVNDDLGCTPESSGVEYFPKENSHSTDMDVNSTCSTCTSESAYFLESFTSVQDAREAIVEMLRQDTRSVYRRTKCPDQLYKVSVDNLNLTCQFRDGKVIVMTVEPKALWQQATELNEDK